MTEIVDPSLHIEPASEAVVWPKSSRGVGSTEPAPRRSSLDGATIGFVWDDLFRGDELFPLLERELATRFADVRIVGYDRFGSSHGADEPGFIAALPSRLAEHGVDAVVSGMGC